MNELARINNDDMTGSVYKKVDLIGSSSISWEDAAQIAIQKADISLKDLRIAEVVRKDIKLEESGVASFRIMLAVSFKIIDA
jgi:hypothetical protein